jgi:hypothetical protein
MPLVGTWGGVQNAHSFETPQWRRSEWLSLTKSELLPVGLSLVTVSWTYRLWSCLHPKFYVQVASNSLLLQEVDPDPERDALSSLLVFSDN